jgi:hypothetical protein
MVSAMSGAYAGEGKTDAKDAYVIAETARLHRDLAVIDADTDTAAVVRDRRRVGAGQGGCVGLGPGATAAIMTGCDTRSGRVSRCRNGI